VLLSIVMRGVSLAVGAGAALAAVDGEAEGAATPAAPDDGVTKGGASAEGEPAPIRGWMLGPLSAPSCRTLAHAKSKATTHANWTTERMTATVYHVTFLKTTNALASCANCYRFRVRQARVETC